MMNWRPSHETLYTFGVICLICGTGLHRTFKERRRHQERRAFATEYRSKFLAYVNSAGQHIPLYNWLVTASTRMQVDMQGVGIYAYFRSLGFQMTNYPIILNGIPALRDAFDKNERHRGLYEEEVNGYIQNVNDALLRYLGSLEYALAHLPSPWNPLIWFREGVTAWLASPLTLLDWFGVIGAATVSRIVGSKPFQAFGGIVTVVGFVSGIFGIVLGWEDMHKILLKLLGI